MSEKSAEAGDQKKPVVFKYDEMPWDGANRPVKELKGLMKEAAEKGAKRKKVITGQAGFYMNRSVMPANFTVPVHSHSHNEFFVVMEGGCTFDDDVELAKGDCIVIYAKHHYGFTCGPEGMDFMTIRTGEASLDMEE